MSWQRPTIGSPSLYTEAAKFTGIKPVFEEKIGELAIQFKKLELSLNVINTPAILLCNKDGAEH